MPSPGSGGDCCGQIAPRGEPRGLISPARPAALQSGGEAAREPAARARCASAGAAGADGVAVAGGARGARGQELARSESGRCWAPTLSPHLSQVDFGAGGKQSDLELAAPIVKLPNSL